MSYKIRQIHNQEMLDVLFALNQYSLHPSPPFEDKENWQEIVGARAGVNCFAAYESNKAVSVAATTDMTQNIRGKLYPAGGVWGVSTDPSVRRKGYCRETIEALLENDHENGKVFSNLYPFRESFYQRLGYVAFPIMKIARLSTSSLSPLLKLPLEGEIELKIIGEAYDEYRQYLTSMRETQHGMAVFDFGGLAKSTSERFWVAIARFNGKIEGLMLYRITGEEVTKYNFIATRFYYQSSRARFLILNWIARHIDQTSRAEIWLPEFEYPELWFADLDVKLETANRPAMCRILDVKKIGGMQVGQGEFAVKITDPTCPWNEGTWQFSSIDGTLQVTKSSQADCEISIQGLSALVTGTRDPEEFPFLGWGNPNLEQQSIMKQIFPPARPYIHEMF
jgi:predicted acetyltransferase